MNRVPLNEPFGMDLDQQNPPIEHEIEDCEEILAELKMATAATEKITVFKIIQKIREIIQKIKNIHGMKQFDEFIEDLIGNGLVDVCLDILRKFAE